MAGDDTPNFSAGAAPEGDWNDDESVHGEPAHDLNDHHETVVAMGLPPEQGRFCGWCGSVNLPDAERCYDCGLVFEGMEGLRPVAEDHGQPALDGQTVIGGRYRLLYALGEYCSIRQFAALLEENGRSVACILHVAEGDDPPLPASIDDINDSSLKVSTDAPTAVERMDHLSRNATARIRLEHEFLLSNTGDALPKVIELFRSGKYLILVLLNRGRQPLSHAWRNSAEDDLRRVSWMRQLHDFFNALHASNWILPTLKPSDLWVDSAGHLVVRDISQYLILPVRLTTPLAFNHYSAPEISSARPPINRSADTFTFGALVAAMCLGRELRNDDFLYRGVPRKLHEMLPHLTPSMSRLLGRTFVPHLEGRATFEQLDEHDTAILTANSPIKPVAINELIADCERESRTGSYDVAGWSSTGLIRDNNEDAFAVMHVPTTLLGLRREIVAVALADGMGGHLSGEVASSLAVTRVFEHLAKNGLFSAALEGNVTPFHQRSFCRDVVIDAVRAANWRVHQASQEDQSRRGMGCTMEVVLIVDRVAYMCHVGDSRIYHRRRGALLRLTRDHTVVEAMRQLGEISAEEAERHPRRSELSQAMGISNDLDIAVKSIELASGDWLVICSDGLTLYLRDPEIEEVLASSASAEAAARTLVNISLARGGADNCTVVVVRVN